MPCIPVVLPLSRPYQPLGAKLAGYFNELSIGALVAVCLGEVRFILTTSWVVARKVNPRLPISDTIAVMWFILCQSNAYSLAEALPTEVASRRIPSFFS